MKFVSWNVNGLRAAVNKGFKEFFKNIDADAFCIQETKMQENQIDEDLKNILKNHYCYWNSADKKGYSGTAVFVKEKPISVSYGINNEEFDNEGRVITLEYKKFYLVNCYTPNSKRELERLEYRQLWEDEIRKYLKKLDKIKPIIYCGDFNVAHKEIDLKNPKTNQRSAGFTIEERNKMTLLLNDGFIDTYRYLYPNKEETYTWWSYMFHAREKNVGWRIDYFIISDIMKAEIEDVSIHSEIYGSDHCPIELNIRI